MSQLAGLVLGVSKDDNVASIIYTIVRDIASKLNLRILWYQAIG